MSIYFILIYHDHSAVSSYPANVAEVDQRRINGGNAGIPTMDNVLNVVRNSLLDNETESACTAFTTDLSSVTSV